MSDTSTAPEPNAAPASTSAPGPKPKRRMARESRNAASRATATETQQSPASIKAPSRLDQLEQLLIAPSGASIAEMVEATGWQQHSVRGAMAGALKKRGLTVTSEKIDGIRRYYAEKPA